MSLVTCYLTLVNIIYNGFKNGQVNSRISACSVVTSFWGTDSLNVRHTGSGISRGAFNPRKYKKQTQKKYMERVEVPLGTFYKSVQLYFATKSKSAPNVSFCRCHKARYLFWQTSRIASSPQSTHYSSDCFRLFKESSKNKNAEKRNEKIHNILLELKNVKKCLQVGLSKVENK